MSISTVDGIGEAPLRRTLSMGDIQATSTRYSGVRDQLLSSSSTPADGHPFATIPTPPHSAVSPPRQSWAGPPLVAAAEHTPEDPPAVLSANGASHTAQERRYQSFYVKTAAFLGYGRGSTRTRKELISLIFNFSWTLTQVRHPRVASSAVLTDSSDRSDSDYIGAIGPSQEPYIPCLDRMGGLR
jgi:hypothetical protein